MMRTVWATLALAVAIAGCSGGSGNDAAGNGKAGDKDKGGSAPGAVTELKIEDVRPGKGDPVKAGDLCYVRYRGTLADGTEFDSNYAKDKPLFSFRAGPTGQVIEGWKEGIIGMKEGGERKLSIPWSKAYGEAGSPPKIGPKTDLFFKIELQRVVREGEESTVTRKKLKDGTGPAVKAGDKIEVQFSGKKLDGTEFDSGKYTFTVGKAEVIPGIDAGVVGMRKGGKAKLTLPPAAAFGMMGKEPVVSAGETVEYEITVLSIK
ncbi:MAG: FKBP-type peptidyl-prolyl cis-trans isomerase [Fimbriimonadaceae bacterium]|nr:FKBP-type peptidyl-prolyl cis-trans isomerase [Fimbriimonadaceae bacterium]